MKLVELNGKLIFDVIFHGWNGLSPYEDHPTERIFWVFQQAGVRQIIADGTVGAINPLLEVGDIVLPSDFIDYTKRSYNISHFTDDIIRSTDIVCPYLKTILSEEANLHFKRVFTKGTYGVYECPRLETRAEVQKFYNDRCDFIGHTMMPEALLARSIGACYAPVYLVSSIGAGLSENSNTEWADYPEEIGTVILKAFDSIENKNICNCQHQKIKLSEKTKKHIEWEEQP